MIIYVCLHLHIWHHLNILEVLVPHPSSISQVVPKAPAPVAPAAAAAPLPAAKAMTVEIAIGPGKIYSKIYRKTYRQPTVLNPFKLQILRFPI
jgi:hypothetical protein